MTIIWPVSFRIKPDINKQEINILDTENCFTFIQCSVYICVYKGVGGCVVLRILNQHCQGVKNVNLTDSSGKNGTNLEYGIL